MPTDVFKLKDGKWAFPKNPPDEAWFGVDVSDLLPDGVVIVSDPAPPTIDVVGVTLLHPAARVQGSEIAAFLGGLDIDDEATVDSNSCTFGFYLSTGEHFFRSIHFTRKDK